jgi:glucoamylase
VRINPADPGQPQQEVKLDTASLQIANGGGTHPARNIVSADFLELVRLGVRDPHDPVIVDSVAVIDAVLKHDLPQGPCWRRYNHDGYGQKDDGGAFDGAGTGRCWPLLTGERGHYELAAGRDPLPFILALEKFANPGRMLPEQVWDGEDLPEAHLQRGEPTGAAMPLCWSHAEYLALVRSRKDGVPFDRISLAYERYALKQTVNRFEIWTFAHQVQRIFSGKILRLIFATPAVVRWSADGWNTVHDQAAAESRLGCWFADLPSASLAPGGSISFTFHWQQRWEGRDFHVQIVAA